LAIGISQNRTHLGGQTLEERSRTLVLQQILHDLHTADLLLEVGVLDTRLHDIERCGHSDRSDGSSDGGDEVLRPGGLGVVGDTENVLLGEGRATEQGERAGGVAGHGPAPAAVESGALLGEDAEDAAATEGFRVHLALDLEDV